MTAEKTLIGIFRRVKVVCQWCGGVACVCWAWTRSVVKSITRDPIFPWALAFLALGYAISTERIIAELRASTGKPAAPAMSPCEKAARARAAVRRTAPVQAASASPTPLQPIPEPTPLHELSPLPQ